MDSYAVKFGEFARTIVYSDESGDIIFTYDFPEEPDPMGIVIEIGGIDTVAERGALAVERVRSYLFENGYNVEIYDG